MKENSGWEKRMRTSFGQGGREDVYRMAGDSFFQKPSPSQAQRWVLEFVLLHWTMDTALTSEHVF